jgi:hypothetical protein
MHLTPNGGKRFWAVAILLIVSSATFLNILDSGKYNVEKDTARIFESVSPEDKISLYVMLKNFDAASQTLSARLWFQPPTKYATYLGDSVQAKYETKIQISASKIDYNNSENTSYWYENDYIRGIDVELDADNAVFDSRFKDNWFPFDRYSVTLNGLIEFCVDGCDSEQVTDDVWESLPVEVVPYTASLPGWSSTMKIVRFAGETKEAGFSGGTYFNSQISLYRTPLNVGLTFLIALIFIGGGISMLLLFRSILLEHRPPTLSGLIWAGSTAFTMIQTRGVIPGAPRIGVKFDLFIFYPSLILCFISGGLMFYHWISKDTWSREL